MNTEFDILESRLNALRPSPLPSSTRRHIQHEMDRRTIRSGMIARLFGHHAGFHAALAGAFCLALVVGWNCLPRSSRTTSGDTAALTGGATLLPSWVSFAAAWPMAENTVAVLQSPSTLTNLQIQR